jgi:uncharacterized protein YndB with AHSA1/START domain
MKAPAPAIWDCLVRAEQWPEWYVNSADVVFLEGDGPRLEMGTRFRWKTFGVTIESKVEEFVPGERIAWSARGFGVDAYHAWVLQPDGDACIVLTEETQNGWLATLGKLVMPQRMHRFHQIWLESLEKQAQKSR